MSGQLWGSPSQAACKVEKHLSGAGALNTLGRRVIIRLSGTNVYDLLKGGTRRCKYPKSSLPSLLPSWCHQPGKGSQGSSGFSQLFVSLTPAGGSHTDGRQKYWLLINFPLLREHKCVKSLATDKRHSAHLWSVQGSMGAVACPSRAPSLHPSRMNPPPSTQQLLAISRSWHKTLSARSLAKLHGNKYPSA